MLQKTIFTGVLATAGFMLSTSAIADAAQVYAGATAGQAKWDIDCTGTSSCSNTGSAFKVFGGYNFAPEWAIEVSYFSLGTINAAISNASIKTKATGFDVAGVYKTNFSKDWGGFVKLGLAGVKAETSASVGNLSGSISKNSTQPTVGFGVVYKVAENFAIRADIDSRRVKIVSGNGGSGNVTNYSIGAQSSF